MSMGLSFIYLTCGLLFIIVLLLLQCYWSAKKKLEGFPFYHLVPNIVYNYITGKIPKDVPFTCYLFQFLMDICTQYSKEGLLMMYVTWPVLFISSQDAIRFFANEKAAIDKSPEYDLLADGMGNGLITSNGERWKSHRKIINPAFHLGALIDKVPLFNKHASTLVSDMDKMSGKSSVDLDLLNALKSNYFNALSESVFGLEQIEENKTKNLRCLALVDSDSNMIVQRMFCPWYRPQFLLPIFSTGRMYLKSRNEFRDFVTKVINDMKEHVASSETDNILPVAEDRVRFSKHLQKSFTYLLLKQHSEDPSFTFEDVHNNVNTILIAGYDTVTYTTLWCLFLLGLHPEVQEKAFDEVQSLTDSYVTYEDSCKMVYLEAIIKETLRLYPVIPIFARGLSEDVQYGKYKVPKGTTVVFVAYLSHRNPDIFPNPEKFEPDRFFLPESKTAWNYVPFSIGNRICLGKKYSIIEMKIFLAHILRNFKISSLDTREDIGLNWSVSMIPSQPIRFKITARHSEEKYCNNKEDIRV